MTHYCSLWDSKYLPQGLALYESLRRHSSNRFTLWTLPMDAECARLLNETKLPDMVILGRRRFERVQQLQEIKETRTRQEFCWTCASQLCEYLMRFLPEVTYLDADLFFFSDPTRVFDEIGPRSIAITPHRLIPSKKHLEVNGRFNVGWVTFRGTPAGRECLSQWAADCRERCSATIGCGDQKYLDVWPGKYGDEVCQLGIGVNVAPWNIGQWTVTEGPRVNDLPVVCYHAHEYRHGERLTNYELRQVDRDLIYAPYIQAVSQQKERLEKLRLQTV